MDKKNTYSHLYHMRSNIHSEEIDEIIVRDFYIAENCGSGLGMEKISDRPLSSVLKPKKKIEKLTQIFRTSSNHFCAIDFYKSSVYFYLQLSPIQKLLNSGLSQDRLIFFSESNNHKTETMLLKNWKNFVTNRLDVERGTRYGWPFSVEKHAHAHI